MASVRILHLEDAPADAELVHERLRAEGIDCDVQVVSEEAAFRQALEAGQVDLILSDHALPGFDGIQALRLVMERCPEVPFVFVSGSIGEEFAIETLKSGATDYVLKDHLARLAPAVRRALREAEERASRKRAEERILQQAELLDEARDAILSLDLDATIRYWNRGAERLYGWSAEEALGRKAVELLHPGEPGRFEQALRSVLEAGEWVGELEKETRDGRRVTVDSRWTRVGEGGGRAPSILVIGTDVTEQKLLQAQFLRAQRMESIGTLAGGIAHDLNNVLAPIVMAADVLKRKLQDAKAQRTLAAIESSARRGADMIRQILTFARGVEGERVELDPRQLLRDLEKMVRETFPKSIEVGLDLAPELWSVTGDPTQLHQVLLNLAVNARDAMPHGGRLTLQGRNLALDESYARLHIDARPGPYVVVGVTDSGAGIPPALLEKIFEPFFTTKGVGQGTGLGLSTSLAIVRSHGGFVNVYSEVGRGTSFKVYLPAAAVAAAQDRPAPAAAPLGHGELVLVVDDEAAIREIAREVLEASGYRVLAAGDGSEAVELYAQHPREIAAVVCDMRMPIMDGPATVRALRRIDPRVAVVATSGLGDEAGGAPHEGWLFLPKPYTADALLVALRDSLAGG